MMCLSIALSRPDDILAKGEHLGLEWMVIHNGNGYRCGYVRLPAGHPWHGENYDDIPVTVHGGLTFTEPDKPCDAPGPDTDWWIGFDCAHSGDAPDPELPINGGHDSLFMDFMLSFAERCFPDENFAMPEIRSQEYVERECLSVCEQAVKHG